MFLQSLLLELKKQKSAFYGLLVVILVGICGVACFGVLTGKWSLDEAHTGILMLLIAAIPFVGVILGAMTGSSLRKEPVKSIEELLPVSPLQRVLGAYSASLIYYILIAFVFPLVLANADSMRSLYSTETFEILARFPMAWILLTLIHFHFLSFAFAYWTKNGILGGGLALIIGTFELAASLIGLASDLQTSVMIALFIMITAWAGGFFSFKTIVKRLERGIQIGYGRGLVLTLGLISGGLIGLTLVFFGIRPIVRSALLLQQ